MSKLAWSASVALLLAASGCSDSGPITPVARCAANCTLRQAAAIADIQLGTAAGTRDLPLGDMIIREFSAVSPEGELVWDVLQPELDSWHDDEAHAMLHFAREHGLATTISHFVWDQATEVTGTPSWVRAIEDPTELRATMRAHLERVHEHFGYGLDRLIVVNEPHDYFAAHLYENHFYRLLGPDYIAEAFHIASHAAPGVELWLNEIFSENNPDKSAALVALAADLVARDIPIDGVGLQGHLFQGDPDYQLVEDTLRGLADLGLKVAITELDAPTAPEEPNRLQLNADRLAGMVRVCLAVDACTSVTFWGLYDEISWLNWLLGPDRKPLLFDDDLKPKPAYFAVRDVLAAGRP